MPAVQSSSCIQGDCFEQNYESKLLAAPSLHFAYLRYLNLEQMVLSFAFNYLCRLCAVFLICSRYNAGRRSRSIFCSPLVLLGTSVIESYV